MDLNSKPVMETPGEETNLAHRKPSRRLGLWLMLLLATLLAGLYWYRSRPTVISGQSKGQEGRSTRGGQPVPVAVVPARIGEIPIQLDGLGSVTPFNTVTVRSRVDGQLIRVAFQEGQLIQQGDLLAEIDPRPFQVQLAQAEGQLARDRAQLANANVDLVRYQELLQQDSIPKQQLDSQQSLVGQLEGTIQSDQAQVDNAKLQLIYCRIASPITGRAGFRLVDAGNMVHSSDPGGLVVITQVQPIAVLFTIPEDSLPSVLKKLRAGSRLPVEAFDRSGIQRLASGTLVTLDNQIDPTTGTSKLKAVFSNQDSSLFPNQFVNIKLLLDRLRQAVIVPAVAIQRGPQGTFVFVVESGQQAAVRPVMPGPANGNDISIAAGVSPGELVVVDGADKLQQGSKVLLPSQGKPGKKDESSRRRKE
jgi:multidrug efflux system membrane fusion protein